MTGKSSAIQPDDIDDVTLDKISAKQFIEALQERKSVDYVRFWPEKKKFELELPIDFTGFKVKDFIDIVKGEKKKHEYELPPGFFEEFGPTPQPARVLEQKLDQLTGQIQALADQLSEIK